MRQNSLRPKRRPIRLPGYDYSQAGAYFVTICGQNRECLFGDIVNREMMLSNAGRMVETVWHELPKFYPRVSTDAFQIMPNHVHGIIVITRSDGISSVGAGPCACPVIAQPHEVAQLRRTGRRRENGQPRGGCPYGGDIGE